MKFNEVLFSAVNAIAKPFMGSNIGYRIPLLVKMYYGAVRLLRIEKLKKVTLTDGFDLYVETNSFIGAELLAKKTLETEVTEFVKKIIRKNDTVIDAGANVGCYTVYFGRMVPTGAVYAIEPDDHNLNILKQNIVHNNLSNVEVLPVALGENDGTVSLNTEEDHGHTQVRLDTRGAIIQNTLDTIVLDHKINSIRLLKIDIEGVELMALKGAHKALENNQIDYLLLEVNPTTLSQYEVTVAQLISFLEQHFNLYTMHEVVVNSTNIVDLVQGKSLINIWGKRKSLLS